MKHSSIAVWLGAALAAAMSSGAAAQGNPQEEGAVEYTASPRASRYSGRTHHSSSGPGGPLRVYGGIRLDVAGNFVYMDAPVDRHADPTIAFQGGVDYLLHEYFALGGEMRFNFVKEDGDNERQFLWDLVVKPRGRYQFTNIPLELYGALPVGLSVAAGLHNLDGGASATLGLLGGATYFFTEHLGINGETGAMFHWIHNSESQFARTVDLHRRLAQFSLFSVNCMYAF